MGNPSLQAASPRSIFEPTPGAKQLNVSVPGTVTLRVVLRGLAPLLMDPMSREQIENDLILGQRKPADKDTPVNQRAAAKVIRENGDPDGRIGIPREMLFACLCAGGREVKVPGNSRKNISSAESSLVPSFLRIVEPFFYLYDSNGNQPQWETDVRKGNGLTGTAVGIVRPKFKDWAFECTMIVTLGRGITEKIVPELIGTAGRVAGLGGKRPQKKGEFGLFELALIEEIARTDPQGPQGETKTAEKGKRGRKAKDAPETSSPEARAEGDEGEDDSLSRGTSDLDDDEGEERLAAAGADQD